jgi:hypothetical protein
MKNIELSVEVADGITLSNLKEHRKYLSDALQQWTDNPRTDFNPTGYWLHPDDVVGNTVLVKALDVVISYYGG